MLVAEGRSLSLVRLSLRHEAAGRHAVRSRQLCVQKGSSTVTAPGVGFHFGVSLIRRRQLLAAEWSRPSEGSDTELLAGQGWLFVRLDGREVLQ